MIKIYFMEDLIKLNVVIDVYFFINLVEVREV
jgi:hypothetical protein